jgi:hypothetical protein
MNTEYNNIVGNEEAIKNLIFNDFISCDEWEEEKVFWKGK